jgi:drug/metabolite transporter (DMT)-like permease
VGGFCPILFLKAKFLGELAALLTSVMWTFSAIFFTFAGRMTGAAILNRLRLAFALVFLGLAHLVTQGTFIPLNASLDRWFWLGLSGIIGLTLGDLALFSAYIYIGPRMGTLIMSIVPVFSALLAWVFLGEALRLAQIAGILLAVSGIILVILDRRSSSETSKDRRSYLLGIMFGFLAAAGQTGGLILTKRGLAGDFPALSAVLMRTIIATAAAWLIAILTRQTWPTLTAIKQPKAAVMVLAGSLVGPFIGVWFSTIAIKLTQVGVAATLQSLNPIFLLPFSSWLFGEKITARAAIGTFITIAGVVTIFLL